MYSCWRHRGIALVEVVLALGVLAVAIPVVAAAVVRSVAVSSETRMDAMALQVIDRGHHEAIQRLRWGWPDGEVMAWGCAEDGSVLGVCDEDEYRNGVGKVGGARVRYLMVATGQESVLRHGVVLRRLKLSVEGPAAHPLESRKKRSFATLVRP